MRLPLQVTGRGTDATRTSAGGGCRPAPQGVQWRGTPSSEARDRGLGASWWGERAAGEQRWPRPGISQDRKQEGQDFQAAQVVADTKTPTNGRVARIPWPSGWEIDTLYPSVDPEHERDRKGRKVPVGDSGRWRTPPR